MEINCGRRKNSSSGDKFSFPVIIQDSDEFEFGSATSPASPADHLFSNGKLLPHAFPIQTPHNFSYSRSTSRTSSMSSSSMSSSSKDSLMWSRSNSTNSRSSTCSSARTSTSDACSSSERRLPPSAAGRREKIVRSPVQYQYGSSRRWQLIAAAPVLKHQGSSSRKVVDGGSVVDGKGSKKSRGGDDQESKGGSKAWFGRKFVKAFVSTCKECHAIKT